MKRVTLRRIAFFRKRRLRRRNKTNSSCRRSTRPSHAFIFGVFCKCKDVSGQKQVAASDLYPTKNCTYVFRQHVPLSVAKTGPSSLSMEVRFVVCKTPFCALCRCADATPGDRPTVEKLTV